MEYWKYIGVCLGILVIISVFVYVTSWKSGTILTKNHLVISQVNFSQLSERIEALYLTGSKLFPIINALYTTHWSVVVKTASGYFNITTARYMCVYLYPVTKRDAFRFEDSIWTDTLHVIKEYKPNKACLTTNIYDIASSALTCYNTATKSSYSMLNNNCQHIARYIIETFGETTEEDDPFMIKYMGTALFKKGWFDAIKGPKVLL